MKIIYTSALHTRIYHNMMHLYYLLAFLLINCHLRGSSAQNCQTPGNTQGRCVPYQECSYIVNIRTTYGRNLPEDVRSFVMKSRCVGADSMQFNVCCDISYLPAIPSEPIFTTGSGNFQASLNQNSVALLKRFDCGSTNNNRVSFGNKTRVAEYPWMALLRYDNPNQPFQCGGSLITDRYVITAAHCMVDTSNQLIGVRLGEHDINSEEDCAKRGTQRICYTAQDFGIEKVTPYPGYTKTKHINDVGLIKLSSAVQFRDHISPICLPITNKAALLANFPEKYTLAGWGTTQSDKPSTVLLKADIPSKPRSYCQNIFKRASIRIEHICAGGEDRVDSCKGDSGGPLFSSEIYELTSRFVLYGIVSVGVAKCGDINSYPGVYTNVVQFMPWISNQISS